MRFLPRGPLWRNADFVRLLSGAVVSNFGTLVSNVALPFVAILTLDAGPAEIAALSLGGLVAGFLTGLVAGAWVDRLPRRPILIAADLVRAAVMISIPIAYWLDALVIEHLIVVSVLMSVCDVVFDVADNAFLPTIVETEHIPAANATLSASSSIAEFVGFSSAGLLVQSLTAPIAILVDSVSYLWSAVIISRIRKVEPPVKTAEERQPVLREIVDGLGFVRRHATLLSLAGAELIMALSIEIVGTVYMLYVNQVLGFSPGALGVLFAVGGIGSLIGSALAGRITRRFGAGHALIGALIFVSLGQTSIAFAQEVSVIAVALLMVQQLTDAGWLYYEITSVSLRQVNAPNAWAGRVNGTFSTVSFGGSALGALIGGLLGERIGIRPTLVIGTLGISLAALPILLTPVRRVTEIVEMEQLSPEAEPVR